jgi:hypothetical protein
MEHATTRPDRPVAVSASDPLARWVEEHLNLLCGVHDLASMTDGYFAIAAIDELREFRMARLSWEITSSLRGGANADPRQAFRGVLPMDRIRAAGRGFDLAHHASASQ